MSGWNDDPLYHRLRALPTPEPDARLAADVRQRALEALAAPPARPARLGQVAAAAAVAAGVLVYFGWAIAFVLAPRL